MKNKLPRVVERPLQMGQFTPNAKGPDLIELSPTLKPKEHLDTLLHELLHCFAPFIDEPYVEEIATGLAKVLWREGYRHGKRK
jgi:hypothetical protein